MIPATSEGAKSSQQQSQQQQQQLPPPQPLSVISSFLARSYVLDPSQRLGCTTLIRGSCTDLHGVKSPVIAKTIPAHRLASYLKAEAVVLTVLRANPHPQLPTILDTVDEAADGQAYVIMSDVALDLHTYVRQRSRLPESDARMLLLQLATAVAHCHKHRIVLRDLKLGKIFFKQPSKMDLIIADIECAQPVPKGIDPLLNDQKGSPAYVSPEVLTQTPYDGAAADIWGLGVIFYVMLTGTYPFQDSSPACLFQKIQMASRAVFFPSHVSERAKSLVQRLLTRDPTQRPTAADLVQELSLHPTAAPSRIPTAAASPVPNASSSSDGQQPPSNSNSNTSSNASEPLNVAVAPRLKRRTSADDSQSEYVAQRARVSTSDDELGNSFSPASSPVSATSVAVEASR